MKKIKAKIYLGSNGLETQPDIRSNVLDTKHLFKVLTQVKNGNFSVRMPADHTGINGKVYDTLNEIIDLNEKMMIEFTKAGKIIGKQGKLTKRIPLPNGKGSWHSGVDSLNILISDLVHPTIEIAHVISSVVKGNLSEKMPLEIGGHTLKGEILSVAKEVNYMVKQLNLFSREVTRVANEVGSKDKLGGRGKVKGLVGVWKELADSVNLMACKLIAKESNIPKIVPSVAKRNLSQGEVEIFKDTINRMIANLKETIQRNHEQDLLKSELAEIYKLINPELLRTKVSVFVDLYKKNQQLLVQEQRLITIINELEERVKERTEDLSKKNIELESKNIELLKVNNDLDNFIYTASHDLKAPVSNIEGLVISLVDSLNEETATDDNVKTIIGMINSSILRFKGTIQELTEITKIQKDIEENNAIVDCHEIIEDVKFTINELITESQAKITVNINDCPKINFSRKNLNSIIYNLLSNAIKYRAPKRNPEISIKTHRSAGFIVLTIKDNGLGMNLQDKNKIFSMFKRLHDHVEGSGIGLYIVKRIIDNSGGKIEVESAEGKGAIFKVYFKDHQSAN